MHYDFADGNDDEDDDGEEDDSNSEAAWCVMGSAAQHVQRGA